MSCLAASVAAPASGHPPEEPAHGLNETTFWTFWAGDEDETNVSAIEANGTAFRTLTAGTDVPVDSPPEAAETWNRRDLEEMPETGQSQATHPAAAKQKDGTYLKDVGVAIAAVNPSTRVRLSTSDQPLYVSPSGTVLGTVDYRIAVPAGTDDEDRKTSWSVASHQVDEVRLRINGTTVDSTTTSNIARLNYDDIEQHPRGNQSLTLETTVSVTLEQEIATQKSHCWVANGTRQCTKYWDNRTATRTESVTVSQSRTIAVYELEVSGYRATYPDGDRGTVIYRNQPWYGIELPSGEVRGVWRYYVARDTQWDRLVTTDGTGQTSTHSPVHPVQVHAYPIATGPAPSPRSRVSILETYGRTYDSPGVPSAVELDAISETYTGSFGIAARTESTAGGDEPITVPGLVRGSGTTIDRGSLAEVSLNRSNLTLAVTNTTTETVTVRVQLRDNETGAPIATERRDGYVEIGSTTVNTSRDGIVEVTVPRTGDAVTARYVPGHWWRNIPSYVGDSATAYTGGTVIRYLQVLFELAVPVGSLLLAGFLIDRLTQWGFWPPWRGLR